MAGYGIECILKALVLSVVPPSKMQTRPFRRFGAIVRHDYQWLRDEYRFKGGAGPPREVNRCFTLVNRWSTDLRYSPGNLKERDAESFFRAARVIMLWADGRF